MSKNAQFTHLHNFANILCDLPGISHPLESAGSALCQQKLMSCNILASPPRHNLHCSYYFSLATENLLLQHLSA